MPEHPASPLLLALLAEMRRSFQVRLHEVLRIARDEAGLSASTQFDVERNVWVTPEEKVQ